MYMSVVSFLRNITNKKNGGLNLVNGVGGNCVGVVLNVGTNEEKFIENNEMSDIEELDIDNKNFIIEPLIPLDKERFIIFLSGASGTGKTAMASVFVKQYLDHLGKNVYYVCATSYKDDQNLKNLPIKQIKLDEIEEYEIKDLENSLVVIDDTDFSTNAKEVLRFINMICELGRKFKVNLIFSSHINTKGNSSVVYREVDLYLTGVKGIESNRMIEKYLGVKRADLVDVPRDSAYVCFNKHKDLIITDSKIYKI